MKRFEESVRDLLEELEISQRELARRTIRQSNWGSSAGLSRMLAGEFPPSLDAMEAIASALQVKPEIWPEYRMALWRHDLNPAKVGFSSAYRLLCQIESD